MLAVSLAIKSIISFKAISDRIASLKVKVSGGILNLLSVYSPHDGYTFDARHHFYSDLSANTRKHHAHETTLVFGDFNTQLGYAGCDESNFLGPYMYQKLFHEKNNVLSNRSLFSEYCGTHAFVVAHTLFDYTDDFLVTYHNLLSHAMEELCHQNFHNLIMC